MDSDVDKVRLPKGFLRFLVGYAKFWKYEMLDEETIVIKAPDRTVFNSTYWDAGCTDPKWALTYLPLLVSACIDGINKKHATVNIEVFSDNAMLFNHGTCVIQIDENSSYRDMDEVRQAVLHFMYNASKKCDYCFGVGEVFLTVSQVAKSEDAGMNPCPICS